MPSPTKTTALSKALYRFKHLPEVSWFPLVLTYAPPTQDECDNPNCTKVVELRQAHVVNGTLVVVQMCWECGKIVVRETGMGDLPPRMLPGATA